MRISFCGGRPTYCSTATSGQVSSPLQLGRTGFRPSTHAIPCARPSTRLVRTGRVRGRKTASPLDFHPEHDKRLESLRVLRAILRECTYNPDPFAGEWVRQHVLARFRVYQSKTWEDDHDNAVQDRVIKVRRKARQALHTLRRANDGDKKSLLKVLLLAYGRRGKRRRELLAPLLAPQRLAAVPGQGQYFLAASRATGSDDVRGIVARGERALLPSDAQPREAEAIEYDRPASPKHLSDHEDSGPIINGSIAPEKPAFSTRDRSAWKDEEEDARTPAVFAKYLPHLTPQLRELARSQNIVHLRTTGEFRPRFPGKLEPTVPELNAWRRPMPKSRVKNMTKAWYATFLDRVIPPLPTADWLRLYDLATGKIAFPGVPLRRPGITTRLSALDLVVTHGRVDKKVFGPVWTAEMTPRFMARVWSEVFSLCPAMHRDTSEGEWKVIWGQHALSDKTLVDSVIRNSERHP